MSHELWDRIRAGQSTVLVGQALPEDVPDDILVFRVFCDDHRAPLAPVRELASLVDTWLGGAEASWLGDGASALDEELTLRRRLLDDAPEPLQRQALLRSLNRLATASDRPAALALDAVEDADPATVSFLAALLERPEQLRTPLVLGFRTGEPPEPAARLIALVDAGGVVRSGRRSAGTDISIDAQALPWEIRRTLRACAVTGPTFDVALVAALLGASPLVVLEHLQSARDLGVHLDDAGDGRLRMDPAMAAALTRGLLPSLSAAWHSRLAELLEQLPADDDGSDDAEPTQRDPGAAPAAAERDASGRPAPTTDAGPRDGDGAPAAPGVGPREPGPAETVGVGRGEASGRAHPRYEVRADPARAAHHHQAAGQTEPAIARLRASAREAASLGAYPQAIEYVRKADALARALPVGRGRDHLRAAVLLEAARIQWLGAGPERTYRLSDALETLDEARALAGDDAPAKLGAELLQASAGVLYEMGDPASLERALDELAAASRRLQADGQPLAAARLLNDQAAVWVRLGDPVRANRLLQQSRGAFEAHAARSPEAAAELAETDHLLARLVLHVHPRPGREGDAAEVALRHARAALDAYQRLGDDRLMGRVLETIARLHLERGDGEAAVSHLERAAAIQERLADGLGLARTAEAFAQAMSLLGRPADALAVLGQSVAMNLDKGSALGLAYNRRCLDTLIARADPAWRQVLIGKARHLLARIEEGQARYGAATLHPRAGSPADG